MAKLNIAERRLPQDGRIKLAVQRHARSTSASRPSPTIHGESVVLRILDRSERHARLRGARLRRGRLPRSSRSLERPHGIVLVTGPTGSGKTTTLYAALTALNTPERKIVTIEDPVEYQLPRRQPDPGQAADRADFAHAPALDPAPGPRRHHGRRDPRPGDRADRRPGRADRPSRALDRAHQRRRRTRHPPARHGRRGLPADLDASTASSRSAWCARSAPHCRAPGRRAARARSSSCGLRQLSPDAARRLHRPVGCAACHGTGYRGRTSDRSRCLPFTTAVRALDLRHAGPARSKPPRSARACTRMYEDGLRKALAGVTTLEEVLRVTGASDMRVITTRRSSPEGEVGRGRHGGRRRAPRSSSACRRRATADPRRGACAASAGRALLVEPAPAALEPQELALPDARARRAAARPACRSTGRSRSCRPRGERAQPASCSPGC